MKLSLTTLSVIIHLASYAQTMEVKPLYGNDTSLNLYAFIGEKISVIEFDPDTIVRFDTIDGVVIKNRTTTLDLAFHASYKVILPVFNTLGSDTIDFIVYDHYGRPKFEEYDKVLLYLVKNTETGKYFHLKYQFDPMKLNKRGKWKTIFNVSINRAFSEMKKKFIDYY